MCCHFHPNREYNEIDFFIFLCFATSASGQNLCTMTRKELGRNILFRLASGLFAFGFLGLDLCLLPLIRNWRCSSWTCCDKMINKTFLLNGSISLIRSRSTKQRRNMLWSGISPSQNNCGQLDQRTEHSNRDSTLSSVSAQFLVILVSLFTYFSSRFSPDCDEKLWNHKWRSDKAESSRIVRFKFEANIWWRAVICPGDSSIFFSRSPVS